VFQVEGVDTIPGLQGKCTADGESHEYVLVCINGISNVASPVGLDAAIDRNVPANTRASDDLAETVDVGVFGQS
jgi:hypothetical protein